jgi:hypothetical protein
MMIAQASADAFLFGDDRRWEPGAKILRVRPKRFGAASITSTDEHWTQGTGRRLLGGLPGHEARQS